MYHHRSVLGPVEVAFTDRHGGVSVAPFDSLDLALTGDDAAEARAANHELLLADFAPDDVLCDLEQVHGRAVEVVESASTPRERPRADAAVCGAPGFTLMVRAADCVPLVLADPEAGVVGVAHAGRPGMAGGVVAAVVQTMREQGARALTAWIGPHVCGRCYEVPQQLQAAVGSVVPASVSTTSWGTPSLDLGAGVRSQLEGAGVRVVDVSACTRESPDLYSYRRDGAAAGRHAGLVRLAGSLGSSGSAR